MIQENHLQKTSDSLEKFVFFVFYAQEQIAHVTLCSWQKSDKSDMLFFMSESLFRSQKKKQIPHKKRLNRLKNQWTNSQPWLNLLIEMQAVSKLCFQITIRI